MGSTKLYVFHPSSYMVEDLDRLLAQHAPGLGYENVVVPELLDEALHGGINDRLRDRVALILAEIPQAPNAVILCSCSTFGGCAEEMQRFTSNPIIRIDRPMAEAAIQCGSIVGVAAAVESTLGPTRQLLLSVAEAQGKEISIVETLCADAWAFRRHNDQEGYIRAIASSLERVATEVDVFVLAQRSMAPVAERLKHLDVPVLSSPGLLWSESYKRVGIFPDGSNPR